MKDTEKTEDSAFPQFTYFIVFGSKILNKLLKEGYIYFGLLLFNVILHLSAEKQRGLLTLR